MDPLDPIFPLQVRAARSLLEWNQTELAQRAGVSLTFVTRFERGERLGQGVKLVQLRDALLGAGVRFLNGSNDIQGGLGEAFGVALGGGMAADRRRAWGDLRQKMLE